MTGPREATIADELLVSQLPDDTREALRALAAADALYSALDVDEPEDDGPEACTCTNGAGDYDEHDVRRAYRLGFQAAADIARAPLVLPNNPTAVDHLSRAGIL